MITTFIQHAKNFVSKSQERPVFCSIMFDGENAIATDTKVLVTVPFKSGKCIIGYKDGEDMGNMNIPEYKKIINAENPENIVLNRLHVSQWINTLKMAQKVTGSQIPFCCVENGRLIVKTPDVEFSAKLDDVSRTEKVSFNVQIPYLLNIFKFLNDVHESYFQEVVIEIPEPVSVQPIIIKAGDIRAAISQVRVAEKG